MKTLRSVQPLAFVSLVAVCALFACGGSQAPAPEAPTEAPAEPAPPEAAPPTEIAAPAASEAAPAASAAPAEPAFADKTEDQKKEFMKTVMLPHMKEQFAKLDAKKYEKMSCVTCHGAGAKEGKFKMPNASLPKLDPKDGFAKHQKKTPAVTKFMMETVAPEAGKLLGMPPYNPETKTGFGCFNCHTMQGG